MSSSSTAPRQERHTLLSGLTRKQRAVAEIIAGKITLHEAAEQFSQATPSRPTLDREQLCRSVIGWVHLALCDRPERAELVSAQLESELHASLGRTGGLLMAG